MGDHNYRELCYKRNRKLHIILWMCLFCHSSVRKQHFGSIQTVAFALSTISQITYIVILTHFILGSSDALRTAFEMVNGNIVRSLHFNPFQMVNISNDELCMWHKTDDSIYLNINERISRSPTSTLSFVISFVESRFK